MKTIIKTFGLIILLVSSLGLLSQNTLSGTIRSYSNQMLTLNQVKGDRQLVIDSLKSNADGSFTFTFAQHALPGMYVLKTATGQSIKLIYNRQDIRFVSGGFSEDDYVEFIESPENELWYAYYFLKNMTQYQQDLLKPLLVQYPDDTDFYSEVNNEYLRLQNELRSHAEKTITENPQTLVARYIRTDLTPPINLDQSFQEQREYLKKHFFDHIDFTDEALIRSDILSRKFIDYLALYQQQGLGMLEMQLYFMNAIDRILLESSVNEQVYVFAVTYLIEGFSRMGLNVVTDFLSGLPHLNPGCMEPVTIEQLELAIAPYRKIIVGAKAPEIIGEDLNGNEFILSHLSSKRSLVVFWSTSCPFCLDLLPELKKYETRNPDTKIVSIIISPDSKELREIITKEKLDWLHIIPNGGWRSQVVDDYMVYATPTLVLMDENQNILLKPTNFQELDSFPAE
jgi:thiol-disulfide isomerase/thioredoxin